MEKETIPTYYIPADNLCNTAGITAKWINEDKISVSAYRHITSSFKDGPTEHENCGEAGVYHIQRSFLFSDPILRSLLAESNTVFLNIQQAAKKQTRPDYLKFSLTYRSIVRACLKNLQDAINATTDSDTSEYENYTTIFYSVECVWHLCEILLIDSTPSNVVVPNLLEWVRFHFPSYESKATDLLFGNRDDLAESSSDFMKTVKGMIAQGQIEVARTLLRLHSNADSSSFQVAGDILRTMPIFAVNGGLSLQKFKSKWQYWLTDTESKLATGCLSAEPELEDIIKLVSGNHEAWINLAKESSCWYEFLPGYLFYTEPGCKYFELGNYAGAWLRRWELAKGFRDTRTMNHLDRVILKVMENDMHQVLHDIQLMCDNKWFVTHLTDLLCHCGQLHLLGEQQMDVTKALRQSLLFDFGASLMARDSLWLFGIDYLEHSSVEGVGAMELLLPRIPISSEREALKIISVAKLKGLTEVEQEICRVQAVKSVANDRLGNALEWALRSLDSIFITSIADKFLEHYARTSKILSPDVVGSVGPKMFIAPRLVFLVKYFDFHQYYRCGEFPQASELLVNLMDSKITPEYFWPSLLADAIPLLESTEQHFSSKDTYIILRHLEHQLIPLIEKKKRFVKSGKETTLNLLNDCRIEQIDEIVRLLRLSCARNLARALIHENTFVLN